MIFPTISWSGNVIYCQLSAVGLLKLMIVNFKVMILLGIFRLGLLFLWSSCSLLLLLSGLKALQLVYRTRRHGLGHMKLDLCRMIHSMFSDSMCFLMITYYFCSQQKSLTNHFLVDKIAHHHLIEWLFSWILIHSFSFPFHSIADICLSVQCLKWISRDVGANV